MSRYLLPTACLALIFLLSGSRRGSHAGDDSRVKPKASGEIRTHSLRITGAALFRESFAGV
jgi:hypothetical protein